MNEAQANLARHARALNTRHARGRALPAIVLMTDDTRDVDWVQAVSSLPRGSAVIAAMSADAFLLVLVRPSADLGALLFDLRRHRANIAALV